MKKLLLIMISANLFAGEVFYQDFLNKNPNYLEKLTLTIPTKDKDSAKQLCTNYLNNKFKTQIAKVINKQDSEITLKAIPFYILVSNLFGDTPSGLYTYDQNGNKIEASVFECKAEETKDIDTCLVIATYI